VIFLLFHFTFPLYNLLNPADKFINKLLKASKVKIFFIIFISLILYSFSISIAQTWTLQTSPVTTDLNSICIVNQTTVYICGSSNKVLKTTNGGTNWIILNNGITSGQGLHTIFAANTNVAVTGSDNGTLWRTTDGGQNWNAIVPAPASPFINAVHFFNSTTGFAVGNPSGGTWKMWYTTNAGANWTSHPAPPPAGGSEAGWNNSYFALDTGNIMWGTNANRIWKGSLRGPFVSISLPGTLNSPGIWFSNANTGVIIANNGVSSLPVLRTTNGGTNWYATSFTPSGIGNSVRGTFNTGYLWIASDNKVYRSTDCGLSFSQQTISLSVSANCLAFEAQGLGWLVALTGKIYKYLDPWQGLNTTGEDIPLDYELEQNYPNPFNPVTIIKYSILKSSNVKITVYNILGHEVKTLVNTYKNTGRYSVVLDASDLASGIYFYEIKTGIFRDSKKMIMLK